MIAQRDVLKPSGAELIDSGLNGVRLGMRVIPAMGAGEGSDWCEAFALSSDVLAFSIGDVCGRGPEAVDIATALQDGLRRAVERGLDPSQSLAEASLLLRRHNPDVIATALLGFFDSSSRRLRFASAGHPPPLMVSLGGAQYLEFGQFDLPLGGPGGAVPSLRVVAVPRHALLVFYTDGVTERESDILHGERDLKDAAQYAHRHSRLPSAAVIERELCLSGQNRDDVAIMTARTPSGFAPINRRRIAVRRAARFPAITGQP